MKYENNYVCKSQKRIRDYYKIIVIISKRSNKCSGFEKMFEDGKVDKINTIFDLKLDKLTRSIFEYGII